MEKWEFLVLLLLAGIWIWQYLRDSTAALIWLPGLILINGNIFWRRIVLADDRITVYGATFYGDSHRFERIVRYSTNERENRVDVELTLEQKNTNEVEILGASFNLMWWRAQNAKGNRERIITFSVEPENLDALLNYLRAQGAVAAEGALWKANYLAKRMRLLKERDDIPDEEAVTLLREIEEQLTALNKY